MKNLLTAVLLTLSFGATAGIQQDIEDHVDIVSDAYVQVQLPARISDVEAELELDRIEVKRARAEVTRMSKSVNVPVNLYIQIIQKVEPGLFVAVHRGERFMLSSDRIKSTGYFQQPIVRQKQPMTMITGNGFEKKFSHFVDIDMDANEYMEQEYKKIGFYAERTMYIEMRDALAVKRRTTINAERYEVMIKSFADKAAKKKAKEILLAAAADQGLDIQSKMTDNIESKLDDLMQAILDDVGYVELVKMGVKL